MKKIALLMLTLFTIFIGSAAFARGGVYFKLGKSSSAFPKKGIYLPQKYFTVPGSGAIHQLAPIMHEDVDNIPKSKEVGPVEEYTKHTMLVRVDFPVLTPDGNKGVKELCSIHVQTYSLKHCVTVKAGPCSVSEINSNTFYL